MLRNFFGVVPITDLNMRVNWAGIIDAELLSDFRHCPFGVRQKMGGLDHSSSADLFGNGMTTSAIPLPKRSALIIRRRRISSVMEWPKWS